MAMAERESLSLGRGKWAQVGVPHKDWRCVDQYDAFEVQGEEEYNTCEMCESVQIRFVHVMEHDDYPEQLKCGCVCAGHMEANKIRAASRDKGMRQHALRRAKFPDRKGWTTAARGTPHIKVDGYHLIVVRRQGGFGVNVKSMGASPPIRGKKLYATLRQAQLGCFDALHYMHKKAYKQLGIENP